MILPYDGELQQQEDMNIKYACGDQENGYWLIFYFRLSVQTYVLPNLMLSAMEISRDMLSRIRSDLSLSANYSKGVDLPVKNCWHFSTNGSDVDFLFKDEDDFVAATNRIFVVSLKYHIVILAYSLMDTHVHFVIYGTLSECECFVHKYLKMTSMYLSSKYDVRHKLKEILPDYQEIDNDKYLKIAICYVLKNAAQGGLPYNPLDYPWSSAPLMFRHINKWTFTGWESMLADSSDISAVRICNLLKTRQKPDRPFKLIGSMVFPGEFIPVDIVEKIFRTHKAFHYFMCKSKETDVESVKGSISRLSIPYYELHQNMLEACNELFGANTTRMLSTQQRVTLAINLKSKFNCSSKQIAKVCGLKYDEVMSLI